jgi:hypothetical protein
MEIYQICSYNSIGSVYDAHHLAKLYLSQKLPSRWLHTQAVARTACELADKLDITPSEKALLVVSAWYHDIGYAIPTSYKWHPLDGALLLRGWELDMVASQVAWHTTAEEESKLLGLFDALSRTHPRPHPLIADALTYCDMTNGPEGQRFSFDQRFQEVRLRHGEGSSAVVAMESAMPRLLKIESHMDSL